MKPLDLTTNFSLKKFVKKAFSEYFSSAIVKALNNDPARDVTTFKVDLCLSTLKPLHVKVISDAYDYFGSSKGR